MAIEYNCSFLSDYVSQKNFDAFLPLLLSAVESLDAGTCPGADFTGWVNLPSNYNRHEIAHVKSVAADIRDKCDILIVLGIGGSYLGSGAIIRLLGGKWFNSLSPMKVIFAGNNIDGRTVNDIIRLCDGHDVCINCISKSGNTTETAIAFRIFKEYMENRYGEAGATERIIITTDAKNGLMRVLTNEKGYRSFAIPDDIGGRFSVLTPVGLLPVAAAGFNIDAILDGAAESWRNLANADPESAANRYAMFRNIMYEKGKATEIVCSFTPEFNMMSEWWKQLFGESEGKDGKGLYPASVIYSTDLHSIGQFIQEGNPKHFETFVNFIGSVSDYTIPSSDDNFDNLDYLSGRTLSYVAAKARDATIKAHTAGGVPVSTIDAGSVSEYTVGELIYFFERACGVSGNILGVNVFNQPGVEMYKNNMFALLGKPGY